MSCSFPWLRLSSWRWSIALGRMLTIFSSTSSSTSARDGKNHPMRECKTCCDTPTSVILSTPYFVGNYCNVASVPQEMLTAAHTGALRLGTVLGRRTAVKPHHPKPHHHHRAQEWTPPCGISNDFRTHRGYHTAITPMPERKSFKSLGTRAGLSHRAIAPICANTPLSYDYRK